MEIRGELLKHLASLKEKYDIKQEDIEKIINLVYEMITKK